MGLILTATNADFSTGPVGHVGLATTIASGLQALFELRSSASKSTYNSLVGGAAGYAVGTPSYSAQSDNVSPANYIQFPSRPANGGLSYAFVVKMKNLGTVSDGVVGTDASLGTQGCTYANLYNRRIAINAYTYASNVSPLSGFTSINAYLDFTAPSDGTYELFFGVLNDTVALTIYNPKASRTLATATTRYFGFDYPTKFRLASLVGGGAQDVSMFAHWNRVLSTGEMDTFYGEMKAQLGAVDLTI